MQQSYGQSNEAEGPKDMMQMLAKCDADVQKTGQRAELSGKTM